MQEGLGLGAGQGELAALGAVDDEVSTDDRLVRIVEPGEPALDLALELVHHAVARDARHRAPSARPRPPRRRRGARAARAALRGPGGAGGRPCTLLRRIMPLAEEFQEILDALPSDWTDLELDLRVQEDRYIDAASMMVTCNAQPYSHARLALPHDRRAPVRPRRGRAGRARDAASCSTTPGSRGELALREVREGRVEVTQMWGVRSPCAQEFRRRPAARQHIPSASAGTTRAPSGPPRRRSPGRRPALVSDQRRVGRAAARTRAETDRRRPPVDLDRSCARGHYCLPAAATDGSHPARRSSPRKGAPAVHVGATRRAAPTAGRVQAGHLLDHRRHGLVGLELRLQRSRAAAPARRRRPSRAASASVTRSHAQHELARAHDGHHGHAIARPARATSRKSRPADAAGELQLTPSASS